MFHRGFYAADPSSSDFHIFIGWGIWNSSLAEVGSQGLCCLWTGHGAGIVDIPFGNRPGDIVSK